MISAWDFKASWQGRPLIRVKPEYLETVNIPDSSKDFLIYAGLPTSIPMADSILSCECLKDGMIPLQKHLESEMIFGPNYDEHLVIGIRTLSWNISHRGYLCIKENSGEIFFVYIEEDEPFTLINSSIEQFAESLLLYYEYIQSVPENLSSPDNYWKFEEMLFAVADKLCNIDLALGENGFWPTFVMAIST